MYENPELHFACFQNGGSLIIFFNVKYIKTINCTKHFQLKTTSESYCIVQCAHPMQTVDVYTDQRSDDDMPDKSKPVISLSY